MLFTETHGSRKAFAKDPAVVRLNNTYYLYYSTYAIEDDKEKLMIGISRSIDMENWEFVSLFPLTQDCEKNGVGAPGAFMKDGVVHLFYQTYGNGVKDSICHAVSNDGVNFEKDTTNPIFSPSKSWCCGRAIDADVVEFKDKLYLYFATRDFEMRIQKIGCAYAPITSDYSRNTWQEAVAAPVLFPEYDWEGACTEAPATLAKDGKIYMFYGGAYNCSPQVIGYAVSSDGIRFEKPLSVPFLRNGQKGDWNESESGHPYIFEDTDGKIYLFYQGSPDGGKTWYLTKKELYFDGEKPILL